MAHIPSPSPFLKGAGNYTPINQPGSWQLAVASSDWLNSLNAWPTYPGLHTHFQKGWRVLNMDAWRMETEWWWFSFIHFIWLCATAEMQFSGSHAAWTAIQPVLEGTCCACSAVTCNNVASHGNTNLTAGEVKCSVLHSILQSEIGFRAAHQQF